MFQKYHGLASYQLNNPPFIFNSRGRLYVLADVTGSSGGSSTNTSNSASDPPGVPDPTDPLDPTDPPDPIDPPDPSDPPFVPPEPPHVRCFNAEFRLDNQMFIYFYHPQISEVVRLVMRRGLNAYVLQAEQRVLYPDESTAVLDTRLDVSRSPYVQVFSGNRDARLVYDGVTVPQWQNHLIPDFYCGSNQALERPEPGMPESGGMNEGLRYIRAGFVNRLAREQYETTHYLRGFGSPTFGVTGDRDPSVFDFYYPAIGSFTILDNDVANIR